MDFFGLFCFLFRFKDILRCLTQIDADTKRDERRNQLVWRAKHQFVCYYIADHVAADDNDDDDGDYLFADNDIYADLILKRWSRNNKTRIFMRWKINNILMRFELAFYVRKQTTLSCSVVKSRELKVFSLSIKQNKYRTFAMHTYHAYPLRIHDCAASCVPFISILNLSPTRMTTPTFFCDFPCFFPLCVISKQAKQNCMSVLSHTSWRTHAHATWSLLFSTVYNFSNSIILEIWLFASSFLFLHFFIYPLWKKYIHRLRLNHRR